jgi:hypothetical protein
MRRHALAIAAAALFVAAAAAFFAFSSPMSRIVSAIRIHREIGDVFDFFTTPKNWPRWHPASISVAGATDHSLDIGEKVTEEIRFGSRTGNEVWRVTARLERDMEYRFNRLWSRLLNALFIRRHFEREPQQALSNAKEILEK